MNQGTMPDTHGECIRLAGGPPETSAHATAWGR